MPKKQRSSSPVTTTTSKKSYFNDFKRFIAEKSWVIFIGILLVGLYLRFYHIENIFPFGWDQARDAFMMKNILSGHFSLVGPKTGVGNFHLGPLYYYLLVPFYFFTGLDPIASQYLNIVFNIINFLLLFVITKKIFNTYAALFVSGVYAVSSYIITLNQVPWNVTIMPGLSALIFYAILQIYQEKYQWVFIVWVLAGLFFQVHFTAVFVPFIILSSLLFVKNKKKVIYYSLLSIPLYVLWFVPNIIYELQQKGGDYGRLQEFLHYYFLGFHFKFFLHRLPDGLLEFNAIINAPHIEYIKYIIPLLFLVTVVFFEKNKQRKILAYVISMWFFIPLVLFSLYGGSLSDYYFFYDAPFVLFILWYLQEKLFLSKYRLACFLLIFYWGFYIYANTKDLWLKPSYGGLHQQKDEVSQAIQSKKKLEREETIKSYLYTIWTEKK